MPGPSYQIASHFGAHVIGTTSTLEKADLARKNGAEVVVVGGKEGELQAAVRLTRERHTVSMQSIDHRMLLCPS
jgi:NADPH:quinone reductase-like Zn-dependent oxidoreductase